MLLSDSVATLARTSPITIKKMQALEIKSVYDLINYVPFRYENYSVISPINQLQEGEQVTVRGTVMEAKNEFSRITVSVRMTGNSEVLRAVLYKIETSTPLIVINQIDIRPMRGIRSRTTHQVEPSNQLNINFQAVSFMRKQPE